MLAGVEYNKIDDLGLHITLSGKQRLLKVDHVIICAGQEPLIDLMPDIQSASEHGPRFHRIGGAALATELDAKRAIREGAVLASRL